VLNAIKASLVTVPTYRTATIKRTDVAVTLALSSRAWVVDIVPAVAIADAKGDTIPDGKGQWMRTDPRVDDTIVTTAHTRHVGQLLPLLRPVVYSSVRRWQYGTGISSD
jgi:hypothetical protein